MVTFLLTVAGGMTGAAGLFALYAVWGFYVKDWSSGVVGVDDPPAERPSFGAWEDWVLLAEGLACSTFSGLCWWTVVRFNLGWY